MPLMLVAALMLPAVLIRKERGRDVRPYMAGANTMVRGEFTGSMGRTIPMALKNYYLAEVFPEGPLSRAGVVCALALIAALTIEVIR